MSRGSPVSHLAVDCSPCSSPVASPCASPVTTPSKRRPPDPRTQARVEQLLGLLELFDADLEEQGRLTHSQMREMGSVLVSRCPDHAKPWRSGSAPPSPTRECRSPGGSLIGLTTMRPPSDFIDYYYEAIEQLTEEHFLQCCVQIRRIANGSNRLGRAPADLLETQLEEQELCYRQACAKKSSPPCKVPESRDPALAYSSVAAASSDWWRRSGSDRPLETSGQDGELDEQQWHLRDVDRVRVPLAAAALSELRAADAVDATSQHYDSWRVREVSGPQAALQAKFDEALADQDHYLRADV